MAGGEDFKQLMMSNNGGFSDIFGFSGRLVLKEINDYLYPVKMVPEDDEEVKDLSKI
ncbi:hypothetical protein [Elizabethkingia anophelis]|uniref:hypothetical protein n=1 Tax=Elizabethkingia anophelis TaxID=1117645 RepID=UPI0013DDA4D7|nr:hypothetical protein [Elizabethkingia anophelis]